MGRRNRLTYHRERIRRHALLGPAYRGGVFVTGLVVALVGIALLVLPGPGWLLIFLGLAILATEFRWARRTLHWTKGRYQQARDRVTRRRTDPSTGAPSLQRGVGSGTV